MEFTFRGIAARRMKPKEQLMSIALTEQVTDLVQSESYRRTAEIINKFHHRQGNDEMVPVTVEARTMALGNAISHGYKEAAAEVLESHKINQGTGLVDDESELPYSVMYPQLPGCVSADTAKPVVDACNEGRGERERVVHMDKVLCTEASPQGCVYISVDDIGVRRQKDERKSRKAKDRKNVENTVIHIQSESVQHTLTAVGMQNAFILLLAFLLENNLMENRRLIFLTDGARIIKASIEAFFGFREYTVILDWLHLKKKCKECLSMGVKGVGKTRDERKDDKARIIRELLRILWEGNVAEATAYLNELNPKNISRQDKVKELIGYLERKKEHVACYAFRHKMGLRVSSNRVEKANDILVAKRQKNNGMAWSEKGSGALAVITAMRTNNKLVGWLRGERELLKLGKPA